MTLPIPFDEVTKSALEPVTDVLKRLLGPAADEFGDYFGLKARLWRIEKTRKLLERTRQKAAEAGRTLGPVPLKTLLPIFEGASLEDDETLSDGWANLLSNAATDPRDDEVRFAWILRQISPEHASILQAIAAPNGCVSPPQTQLDEHLPRVRSMTFIRQDASYWMDQMVSLGLCRLRQKPTRIFNVPGGPDESFDFAIMATVHLSDLGARFLAAVQPPKRVRVQNPLWEGTVELATPRTESKSPTVDQTGTVQMHAWVAVGADGSWHGIGRSYSLWPWSDCPTNIGTLTITNRPTCYPYEYEFRGSGPAAGPLLEAMRQRT